MNALNKNQHGPEKVQKKTFFPERLNSVSSTATVSGDPAGKRWVTMRSARANPSASPDQRAVVNNRCARL